MCTEKGSRWTVTGRYWWPTHWRRVGLKCSHMLADGSLEDHNATMDRLLDEDRREGDPELYPNGDMFRSKTEVVADALARRAGKVAFKGEASPARSRERGRELP